MADGYSKIKAACKFKSRSIDYSDLSSLPHSLTFNNAAVSNPISHHSNHSRTNRPQEPPHRRLPEEDEEVNDDECDRPRGGTAAATLSRNSSVSSSVSGFQSAVKRALSMRRSSSVAERYCRIHDQFATFASPIEDDELEGGDSKERGKLGGSAIKKKKKTNAAGKIVRALRNENEYVV
ncbi:hypothetical protein E5676_scaffold18G00790 [Cucumis melo var. makuwa]|uniref:Uncharacterized protein n=1 Tax=Cucumis melo var. makuwa TaxID=1194695 RepID=A0A5A7V402_CUCMM|nr:hypothetical protein E6C27_scaffold22G004710 [Cucumis melo var. makuwa]TYK02276.1 hypothetical protein E5676_scaffold18G00790 [Cucumis melo var. makuwa]